MSRSNIILIYTTVFFTSFSHTHTQTHTHTDTHTTLLPHLSVCHPTHQRSPSFFMGQQIKLLGPAQHGQVSCVTLSQPPHSPLSLKHIVVGSQTSKPTSTLTTLSEACCGRASNCAVVGSQTLGVLKNSLHIIICGHNLHILAGRERKRQISLASSAVCSLTVPC